MFFCARPQTPVAVEAVVCIRLRCAPAKAPEAGGFIQKKRGSLPAFCIYQIFPARRGYFVASLPFSITSLSIGFMFFSLCTWRQVFIGIPQILMKPTEADWSKMSPAE